MGAIAKLLGTFGTGGWLIYVVIGLAVFGAGSAAGYKARGLSDAPIIATAKSDAAIAEKATEAQKRALSDYHAQVEKERADANAIAVTQEAALRGAIKDLQVQLSAKEAARQRASNQLLETLHAIPLADQVHLSAGASDYYRRVREQQANGAANPATAGNPNPPRVP